MTNIERKLSFRSQGGRRFVESYMAIASESQDLEVDAPAQRPAHKVLQVEVVLERLLDIESVAAAFPVILGMECTVTLDPDIRLS